MQKVISKTPLELNYDLFAQELVLETHQAFKDVALNGFLKQGLPNKKNENWIYTHLQKALPQTLKKTGTSPKAGVSPLPKELEFSGRLEFIGQTLNLQELPPTMELSNHLDEKELNWIKKSLEQDGLSCLNLLAQTNITKLLIKKGTQTKTPFLLNFQIPDQSLTVSQPFLFIEIEQGAEVCLLELVEGQAKDHFMNAQVFLHLHPQARVEHVTAHPTKSASAVVTKKHVEIMKDAFYRHVSLNLGAEMTRYENYIALKETGAHAELFGLYALQGEQHADTFVQLHHEAAHTTSAQLFKGILSDSSRGVFTGKVTVHRDAQQVDSSQLNKNLLLGDKAHADTRPQLEVYADDVKCSHGATVGQIDQDEVFYLQSRGLNKERALLVLCHAFGAEVLEKIENVSLKTYLNQLFEKEYEADHFQKGKLS